MGVKLKRSYKIFQSEEYNYTFASEAIWGARGPVPACQFDLELEFNNVNLRVPGVDLKQTSRGIRLQAFQFPQVGLNFDAGAEYMGHAMPTIMYGSSSFTFMFKSEPKKDSISEKAVMNKIFMSQFDSFGLLKWPKDNPLRYASATVIIDQAPYCRFMNLKFSQPIPTNLNHADVNNFMMIQTTMYFNDVEFLNS